MCETWNDPRLHHVCPCIMVTFLLAVSKYPIKQLSRRTVCFSSGSEEEYSQWGLGRFGVRNTRQLVMLTHSEEAESRQEMVPGYQTSRHSDPVLPVKPYFHNIPKQHH